MMFGGLATPPGTFFIYGVSGFVFVVEIVRGGRCTLQGSLATKKLYRLLFLH